MPRRPTAPPPEGAISGTLRILSARALHGPNRWSRLPIIHLLVDLGELEHLPSDRIPGFTARLVESLPGLARHNCSLGRAGGFIQRLETGTWMGHVAEHVALELERRIGGRSTRGKTRSAGPDGHYDIIFAYEDEQVGLAAGRAAVALVNRVIEAEHAEPDHADAVVAELQALADRRRLGLSTQAIVDQARRRHIPWARLNERNLVQLGWGIHARRIRATVTSGTSLIGAELARDKDEVERPPGARRCARADLAPGTDRRGSGGSRAPPRGSGRAQAGRRQPRPRRDPRSRGGAGHRGGLSAGRCRESARAGDGPAPAVRPRSPAAGRERPPGRVRGAGPRVGHRATAGRPSPSLSTGRIGIRGVARGTRGS
ncbi:MAG: hypothetical protein WKF78_09670 [Candidatus Limnocylindrales bacterium]